MRADTFAVHQPKCESPSSALSLSDSLAELWGVSQTFQKPSTPLTIHIDTSSPSPKAEPISAGRVHSSAFVLSLRLKTMPRATSNSLFAGTPAPPKPAAAPPPVQLPRDENAPYLGPDGQLCIGQPMPPRKIQSPYLYIEKLLLDNSKTLDGSKEGHALRLELLPLSRQMVIGYVAAGEGSEEEKGKTIRHELTLSYKTLRSAKVSRSLPLSRVGHSLTRCSTGGGCAIDGEGRFRCEASLRVRRGSQ